jgi:chloride channel protein, CIC family
MAARYPAGDEGRGSTLVLALLAMLVGGLSGLVCVAFRLILRRADELRGDWIALAQQQGPLGLLMVIALAAAATALAATLVSRFSPEAGGSGIPEVEAALNGGDPGQPVRNAVVKFIGGVLAIGSGLALGREGPSVQMGHSIGDVVGRLFHRAGGDARVLFAAGAGAGLATAFNAPVAGAIFVLEELLRRFDIRNSAAALGASAVAITVARIFLGVAPDFEVPLQPFPPASSVPLFALLGIVTALVAALYAQLVLASLQLADRSNTRLPVVARAALIGAAVGALGFYAPSLVGGGESITQQMFSAPGSLSGIALIFGLRFLLGPLSYAAGTPGGLFAPMLVLGAQVGVVAGQLSERWFAYSLVSPAAFAVVGMAAFFTAIVRAPLTGICLAVEMTGGTSSLLLPMLAACFSAMVVMSLLGVAPIYDQLSARAKRT